MLSAQEWPLQRTTIKKLAKFKTCNFVKNYFFIIELFHRQVQHDIVSMQSISTVGRSAYKIQISRIAFRGSLDTFYLQKQDPTNVNSHTEYEAGHPKYMNGSLFSKPRSMNGVCFEMFGRTSVPKSPLVIPPHTQTHTRALEYAFLLRLACPWVVGSDKYINGFLFSEYICGGF